MLLLSVDAPSGSFDETKRTGSCMLGSCVLKVVHAMEWEDPQATRFTCTSSKPCTGAGLRFTMVVPLPCCPWSLSPHAYTWLCRRQQGSAEHQLLHEQSSCLSVLQLVWVSLHVDLRHAPSDNSLLCPMSKPGHIF